MFYYMKCVLVHTINLLLVKGRVADWHMQYWIK